MKPLTVNDLIQELLSLREEGMGDCDVIIVPDSTMYDRVGDDVTLAHNEDYSVVSVDLPDPEKSRADNIREGFVSLLFTNEVDELEPL